MRMDVKLFTLQMRIVEAAGQSRNSAVKKNGGFCIPKFAEDETKSKCCIRSMLL
jgi:hypothetical protein